MTLALVIVGYLVCCVCSYLLGKHTLLRNLPSWKISDRRQAIILRVIDDKL